MQLTFQQVGTWLAPQASQGGLDGSPPEGTSRPPALEGWHHLAEMSFPTDHCSPFLPQLQASAKALDLLHFPAHIPKEHLLVGVGEGKAQVEGTGWGH